jgi:hypothetical protein
MAKNVALSDPVIKKLDILRNERNESYSKIIESCLKSSFDIDLDLINEHFEGLKRLIPNLKDSTELVRVAWVRFYRLSNDKQKMRAEMIYESIEKVFKEGIEIIGDLK